MTSVGGSAAGMNWASSAAHHDISMAAVQAVTWRALARCMQTKAWLAPETTCRGVMLNSHALTVDR